MRFTANSSCGRTRQRYSSAVLLLIKNASLLCISCQLRHFQCFNKQKVNQISIFLRTLPVKHMALVSPLLCGLTSQETKHSKQPNMVIIRNASRFVLTTINTMHSLMCSKCLLSRDRPTILNSPQFNWSKITKMGHFSRFALSEWNPILCFHIWCDGLPWTRIYCTPTISWMKRNTATCWRKCGMATPRFQ